MSQAVIESPPSRLRIAAFAPIGEEGRAALVEARLVQAISVGAFLEGERLPSETEISQLLGVSVVTVREALGSLRHSGLIETRRGRSGGSFVRPSCGVIEGINASTLRDLPRVALADLGVHYEVVASACAELACRRATGEELEVIEGVLKRAGGAPREVWRRRVTEVQLELAALSQSVRLTNEHVRLQTELTPFLALQDSDEATRLATHDALLAQISATQVGHEDTVREIVRESVRASMRWLVGYRNQILDSP